MSEAERMAADITPISSHMELLVQLLKQASIVSRPMLEGVAAPNAISVNELKIVMCLGGEGALAGHDISDIMGIPPMNVSRALAALAERGWIEAVHDPANRRRKPVQLSEAGWCGYRAMTPDFVQVAEYLLGTLTAAERSALARINAKILARMESWSGDHPEGEAQ